MAAKTLYAYPTDDIVTTGTVTMSGALTGYPATNIKTYDPSQICLTGGTSSTIVITPGGSRTVEGIAIINHNWTTATLSSSAGSIGAITMPARSLDGQCINAFLDLRLLSNRTGSSFTIAVSGAANVGVGRICLVTTLRELRWRWGGSAGVQFREDWPNVEMRTFYQSRLVWERGVRVRSASGVVAVEEDRPALMNLARAAKGSTIPWLLIPEQTVNDAMYVRFTGPFEWTRQVPDASEIPIDVEEAPMGLPI